jgi:hypothetical protein
MLIPGVTYITGSGGANDITSDLGVYEKATEHDELILTGLFGAGLEAPAVQAAREACGWDLRVAPALRRFEAPTDGRARPRPALRPAPVLPRGVASPSPRRGEGRVRGSATCTGYTGGVSSARDPPARPAISDATSCRRDPHGRHRALVCRRSRQARDGHCGWPGLLWICLPGPDLVRPAGTAPALVGIHGARRRSPGHGRSRPCPGEDRNAAGRAALSEGRLAVGCTVRSPLASSRLAPASLTRTA